MDKDTAQETDREAGQAKALLPHRRNDLAGVVLAGGRSSRMGTDKAALVLPDGTALLERLLLLEADFVSGLMLSVRGDRPLLQHLTASFRVQGKPQLQIVPDACPEIGPMGGLVTCLDRARHVGQAGLLVLSCDIPLVNAQMLAFLLAAYDTRPAGTLVTALAGSQGRVHPLMAVWEVQALPLLHRAMDKGDYSLMRALPEGSLHTAVCTPAQDLLLTNVNTPAEWGEVCAALAGPDSPGA